MMNYVCFVTGIKGMQGDFGFRGAPGGRGLDGLPGGIGMRGDDGAQGERGDIGPSFSGVKGMFLYYISRPVKYEKNYANFSFTGLLQF